MLLFCGFGILNTLLYIVMYNALRGGGMASLPANAVTLLLTVSTSFYLNRRITFDVRGRAGLAEEAVRFVATYAGTAALSTAAIALLFAVVPNASRTLESVVAVGSNAGLLVVRFAVLRLWVFARPDAASTTQRIGADRSGEGMIDGRQ